MREPAEEMDMTLAILYEAYEFDRTYSQFSMEELYTAMEKPLTAPQAIQSIGNMALSPMNVWKAR